MKVTIGKKAYAVQFYHHMDHQNNKKKKRFVTDCSIGELVGKENKIFLVGKSVLNPIDKLDRNLGKARALQNTIILADFPKSYRVKFWEEFHKNFKI